MEKELWLHRGLVTKDVSPYSIVAGVPAKVIGVFMKPIGAMNARKSNNFG